MVKEVRFLANQVFANLMSLRLLWWPPTESSVSMVSLLYPPLNEIEGGYTGFTLSVYPFVRLSDCGQNLVRSVSSTILAGSISYLHISSSNFRKCVACVKFVSKLKKIEVLANSLNLSLSLCLVSTWEPTWNNSMGNHSWGGGGYPQNAGILVGLVVIMLLMYSVPHCLYSVGNKRQQAITWAKVDLNLSPFIVATMSQITQQGRINV